MKKGEKTIREWLECLPEPYRSQAIANVQKHDTKKSLDKKRTSIVKSLNALRIGAWDEGLHYWQILIWNLEHGKLRAAGQTGA